MSDLTHSLGYMVCGVMKGGEQIIFKSKKLTRNKKKIEISSQFHRVGTCDYSFLFLFFFIFHEVSSYPSNLDSHVCKLVRYTYICVSLTFFFQFVPVAH